MQKIPCIVLVFYDFDINKKALDFITNYSDRLDIVVLENKSINTETKYKPYIKSLLQLGKISKYVLFDDNVGANAFEIAIMHKLVNLKSKYIMITDGDLTFEDSNWLDEELKIIEQQNVFCVGAQLDMSNLPLKIKGAENWVPPAQNSNNQYYKIGNTGWWFLLFKTKTFLKAFKHILMHCKNFGDYSFQEYCQKKKLPWARTINAIAYHYTWDAYANKTEYALWKSQFSYSQIWMHNKYSNYTIYTQQKKKYIKYKPNIYHLAKTRKGKKIKLRIKLIKDLIDILRGKNKRIEQLEVQMQKIDVLRQEKND